MTLLTVREPALLDNCDGHLKKRGVEIFENADHLRIHLEAVDRCLAVCLDLDLVQRRFWGCWLILAHEELRELLRAELGYLPNLGEQLV